MWDALLADPEHQKTLSQVVEHLKASYESGALGEPSIETENKKEDWFFNGLGQERT